MTMSWNRSLDMLQVHCQGEIGKVIVGGAPEIPGATALDKMNHINNVDDSLRRFVTFEPRANVAMTVNLLLAPTRPDADAGFIVLQADRAHPMSGSNCICVATALIESGRVVMREPETIVRLDTPAGLITARAKGHEGRCLSVSVDNVPSFAEMLDREIDTPKWGRIRADVAFGGVYYALVDVDQIGLAIEPKNARTLAEAGIELKTLLAQQVTVQHPVLSGVDEMPM
jgi:proline racemase